MSDGRDERHKCPRDDCEFERYSLLAVEFHVYSEHDTTVDVGGTQ